ncbi:MAG: triose-phosphate isomerase [Gemmatimonadota bacterium]
MSDTAAIRPTVVAGNWKMNLGPEGARAMLRELDLPPRDPAALVVALFPPAISLTVVREEVERLEKGPIEVGCQNVFHEDRGAFTGEISAAMVREAGATLVLVGHSERRHLFGESDDAACRKVEATLRHGLAPLLCVGEKLEERREGRLEEVLLRQLGRVLASRSVREALEGGERFLLAYEPVWAIGTGETATPGDAEQAHAILRRHLAERVSSEVAERIPILYGGSVKSENAAELIAPPEVDGVLVGGASLEAGSFARIVRAVA